MKKVLIVDDDPSILKIAGMRLRAEGVDVVTADDGAEGLRMIRDHRPAVVILDLMMPKVHGFTVLQEVRSDPSLRKTKILVTSAMGYAADVERMQKLGADRYLHKPYDLEKLWEVVSALLGGRKARLAVRFWGTRGSIATPGPATVKYRGNTACTELRCVPHLLILDAGTGIRALGNSVMEGTFSDVLQRAGRAHAKSLAIFHHDPSHDDPFLDGIEEFRQSTIQDRKYRFRSFLAREGMGVEL